MRAEPAYRGDGGQGLPRKPRLEIDNRSASAASLLVAWRLRLRGNLGGRHAGPVVHHPDEPAAAFLHHHRDGRGPAASRAFSTSSLTRRRADDDLPGGDFGRHLGVKVRMRLTDSPLLAGAPGLSCALRRAVLRFFLPARRPFELASSGRRGIFLVAAASSQFLKVFYFGVRSDIRGQKIPWHSETTFALTPDHWTDY